MNDYPSLSHTKWEGKDHVVFIPKYRRTVLYGHLRAHLGEGLREVARQKESTIEEGPWQPDQVHRLRAIPPKYAVECSEGVKLEYMNKVSLFDWPRPEVGFQVLADGLPSGSENQPNFHRYPIRPAPPRPLLARVRGPIPGLG